MEGGEGRGEMREGRGEEGGEGKGSRGEERGRGGRGGEGERRKRERRGGEGERRGGGINNREMHWWQKRKEWFEYR